MLDPLVVEGRGRLDLVGFDAAHVEGLLRGQSLHQRLHRVLKEVNNNAALVLN